MLYNSADDLNSPFMLTGNTATFASIANGTNSLRTTVVGNGPRLSTDPVPNPRLVPSGLPPDILGGSGIAPQKNPSPAPGDFSLIGHNPNPPVDNGSNIPGDSGATSNGNNTGNNSDPVQRLIDLASAFGGGGSNAGGTVALPTTVSSAGGTSPATTFIVVAVIGLVVWFGWKHFHKRAA